VNGHDRTELVATSENVFASKDGTIKVTYKPETETSLEQISVAFAHEGRVSLAHAFTERDWRSVWESR
jgi:N-acetylglucosamine-6-phosphate deacetylase